MWEIFAYFALDNISIIQRNKEIADLELKIKAKAATATEQEMRILERELNTLKYVGNPSMTSEETLKQFQEYASIQKRKQNSKKSLYKGNKVEIPNRSS